jgi:hypothetical protein
MLHITNITIKIILIVYQAIIFLIIVHYIQLAFDFRLSSSTVALAKVDYFLLHSHLFTTMNSAIVIRKKLLAIWK